VRLIAQEQSLVARFDIVLTNVQQKQRKEMENLEDVNIALKDLEQILNESISGSRQSRLDQIQNLMAANSNLIKYLIEISQQQIVKDEQTLLDQILTTDSRIRSEA